MGGYILAILSKIILKQGNIWDIQKVKQKGYLRKNLTQKENEMTTAKIVKRLGILESELTNDVVEYIEMLNEYIELYELLKEKGE